MKSVSKASAKVDHKSPRKRGTLKAVESKPPHQIEEEEVIEEMKAILSSGDEWAFRRLNRVVNAHIRFSRLLKEGRQPRFVYDQDGLVKAVTLKAPVKLAR